MKEIEIDNERQVKGIFIPIEVWNSIDCGWTAKLIFLEIDSFCRNGRECFVSNKHLAMMFNISETQVSIHINALIKIGWLEMVKFDGRKRYLKSTMKVVFESDSAAVLNKTLRQPENEPDKQPLTKLKGSSKSDFNHTDTSTNSNELFVYDNKKFEWSIPDDWKVDEFMKEWEKLIAHLHQKTKKKPTSLTMIELTKKLIELSKGDFNEAKELIAYCIRKGYKDLYEIPKSNYDSKKGETSKEKKFNKDYYGR